MNPDDYSEMICSGCTSKLSFLPAYKHLLGKQFELFFPFYFNSKRVLNYNKLDLML